MEIETILKDFDNSANVFDYIDVSEALGQCSDEVKGTEEYNAEIIAMNLIEAYSSNDDMFNGKFYLSLLRLTTSVVLPHILVDILLS